MQSRTASFRLSGISPAALLALYLVIGVVPLGLATLQDLSPRNAWRELSSGLVMVGFTALLVQFLLSGRFRSISGKVGIDGTMLFHQLAGWGVMIAVLLHPFLYAVPRLWPDPADAVNSLERMFSSSGLRTGVVAWCLLLLLVPLAAWRDRLPFRYEIWRLAHGLGAATIAFLSLHHSLSVGTYSAHPLLIGFWIGLTAIAVMALAHVYVVVPLLQRRRPYRVISNRRVAQRMWEIAVEPVSGWPIDFAPGQFVWLNLGHSSFSLTEHPFSISSIPAERPRIAFIVKESGDFTSAIGSVPCGTLAYLDGPHGAFTTAGRADGPLVFIAGGVGFAPIRGMLRQLSTESYSHPIHLIYGNRVESQILFPDEFAKLKEHLNIRIDLVLSEPPAGWGGKTGELTPAVVMACLGPTETSALYFVCGPTPMMDSVEGTLLALEVPSEKILSERFKYD